MLNKFKCLLTEKVEIYTKVLFYLQEDIDLRK